MSQDIKTIALALTVITMLVILVVLIILLLVQPSFMHFGYLVAGVVVWMSLLTIVSRYLKKTNTK